MPEYCPLYSENFNDQRTKTTFDCKICITVKDQYPEYELFGDMHKEIRVNDNLRCEKVDVYIYTCNLCGSRFDYICDFDLHMKSHTKYGKNVAIIGITSSHQFDRFVKNRVSHDDFLLIEHQLMKMPGVSAILAVFSKDRYKDYSQDTDLTSHSLICSILLKEGVDIQLEFDNVKFDSNLIQKVDVLCVKNYFVMDTSTESQYELGYRRKSFEKLLRWKDYPVLTGCYEGPDSEWYDRSTALLTTRCSLQFPDDQYQGLPQLDVGNFAQHVIQFLWKQVRNSDLCCCLSKFYCSSSVTLEKCKSGCCGKCNTEEESLTDNDG